MAGVNGSKVIEEELKALGIEEGQFQKEALSRQRLDGPIHIEAFEAIRRREEWLNPTGSDAAAHNREQAAATLILGPQAPLPIAVVLGAGYACWELRA